MSPFANSASHLRARGHETIRQVEVRRGVVRLGAARLATGTLLASALLLGCPAVATALPAGVAAPVVGIAGPVVAFYAGTAEVDGSTTLEPTTTGTRSRLDCTILFGKDSDVLRLGAKERLRRLAEQLDRAGAGRVAVTGYTDDLGSAAHGLDLSERRARRVAHELRQVLPAKTFPMKIRGLGEAHPAVPNSSEPNRRKNRRVVVTLTRAQTAPASTRPRSEAPRPTPSAAPSATALPTLATSPSPTGQPPSATSAPPVVAPPPPMPPRSGTPTKPSTIPWPWIGAAGAAVVALGASADALRRRRLTPAPAGEEAGSISPETPPGSDGASTSTPPPRSSLGSAPLSARDDVADEESQAIDFVRVAGSPGAEADFVATDERPALPAPVIVPASGPQPQSALEVALASDLAAWWAPETYRPRLSVLGPVHARTRGKALVRRRPYYTELFAYLVLRPRGATVDEIAEDFNLSPARVRTDMKILRDWLGTDPRTGNSYLPNARTSPAASRRGVAVYQLDGALCDWDLFERLVSSAKNKSGPERVADLQTALDLVAGRPFDQVRPAGWGWLFESDRVDLHAAKATSDIAVDLVAYHRAHQDEQGLDRATSTLAKIDPEKAREAMTTASSNRP